MSSLPFSVPCLMRDMPLCCANETRDMEAWAGGCLHSMLNTCWRSQQPSSLVRTGPSFPGRQVGAFIHGNMQTGRAPRKAENAFSRQDFSPLPGCWEASSGRKADSTERTCLLLFETSVKRTCLLVGMACVPCGSAGGHGHGWQTKLPKQAGHGRTPVNIPLLIPKEQGQVGSSNFFFL